MSDARDITTLLAEVQSGRERAADLLMPAVYDELRRLAGAQLRDEPADLTVQATALVHEAYLRLIDQTRVQWQSRAHFFAIASQAMRRILVDHARARNAAKRGGGRRRVSLDVEHLAPGQEADDLLALHDAMDHLAREHPAKARLVELRFFGGLTNEDAAEVLGISTRTVERHWQFARAWLFREMSQSE